MGIIIRQCLCLCMFVLVTLLYIVSSDSSVGYVELNQLHMQSIYSALPNQSSYIAATSGCLEEFIAHRGGRGNPPRHCRKQATAVLRDRRGNFSRLIDTEPKHLQPRYEYNLCGCNFYTDNTINKGENCFLYATLRLSQSTRELQQLYQHPNEPSTYPGGGSSFEVRAGMPEHPSGENGAGRFIRNGEKRKSLTWCPMISTTDIDYTFLCAIPISCSENVKSNTKLQILILLDYENFGAFDELVSLQKPLSSVIFANQSYSCLREGYSSVSLRTKDSLKRGPTEYDEPATNHFAQYCGVLPYLCNLFGQRVTAPINDQCRTRSECDNIARNVVNSRSNISDRSAKDNFLTMNDSQHLAQLQLTQRYNQIMNTLKRSFIYMVGASHMRYNWDYIVYNYLNATAYLQKLPQHHGSATVGRIHYVHNLFAVELAAVLENIKLDIIDKIHEETANALKSKESFQRRQPKGTLNSYSVRKHNISSDKLKTSLSFVLVIQTGSWDLDYFPPRNLLIQQNSTVCAIVDAIQRIQQLSSWVTSATSSISVKYKLSVVWVNSLPTPDCAPYEIGKSATTGGTSSDVLHSTIVANSCKNEFVSHTRCSIHCFDKGYRNNYAIQATNQLFLSAFRNREMVTVNHNIRKSGREEFLQKRSRPYPVCSGYRNASSHINHARSNHISVIDAYRIVYPLRAKSVCGMHYVCVKRERGAKHSQKMVNDSRINNFRASITSRAKESVKVLTTSAGLKVLDGILTAIVNA